jgi:hypothetical protein
MGLRILTGNSVSKFKEPSDMELPAKEQVEEALAKPLPNIVMPETRVPEYREQPAALEEAEAAADEDLYAMGMVQKPGEAEEVEPVPEGQRQQRQQRQQQPQQPPLTQQGGRQEILYEKASQPMQMPPAMMQPARLQHGGMQQQLPQQMQPIMYQTVSQPMQMPQAMMQPARLQHGGMQQQQPQMQPIMYQTVSQPMQMPQAMMQPARLQHGGMTFLPQPIVYENPSPPMQMPDFPLEQMDTNVVADFTQNGGYTVFRAPVPNGPPTIVIDTTPRMMNQGQSQEQSRRNVTPRSRPDSPRRQRSSMVVDGLTANSKITVSKLG